MRTKEESEYINKIIKEAAAELGQRMRKDHPEWSPSFITVNCVECFTQAAVGVILQSAAPDESFPKEKREEAVKIAAHHHLKIKSVLLDGLMNDLDGLFPKESEK